MTEYHRPCIGCQTPLTSDNIAAGRIRGQSYRCRSCTREYSRKRYASKAKSLDPQREVRCRVCDCVLTVDNITPSRVQYGQRRCNACQAAYMRDYQRKHPKRANERYHERMKDPVFREERRASASAHYHRVEKHRLKDRVVNNLRCRLYKAITAQETDKSQRTMDLIGCSAHDLTTHIESLWEPSMTWENYGTYRKQERMTWHIDHILPCASFDLTDPKQQKACFHWTNLRPRWAFDNISAGQRVRARRARVSDPPTDGSHPPADLSTCTAT